MKLNNVHGQRSAVTSREWRPGGRGSEPLFNASGEMNAGSKQEALARILELAQAIASGEVMNATAEKMVEQTEAEKREVIAELSAAYHDSDRTNWAELGAMIATELSESIDREGFMRRFLLRGDLNQGEIPRHRVKRKTTSALVAAGPSSIQPEMARGYYIWAPEFEIHASVGVSNLEMQQGSASLLDEKFFEAQEQIMRQEDIIFIRLLKGMVGNPNAITYVGGGYTPATVATIMWNIRNFGYDCPSMLIASDVMTDILTATTFVAAFDPVTTHENIMTGTVARLYGTEIVTDQFRDPRLKVLAKGEVFALAPPEYVGGYTDRGPVESVPVDHLVINGHTSKGWNMAEILSITTHNGRGVSQGSR